MSDLSPSFRPPRVLRMLVAPYAVGAFVTAVPYLWVIRDHADEGFLLWAAGGLLLGTFTAFEVAAIVSRADRAARRPPAGGLWLVAAALLVQAVHWAPLALYLPVALVRAALGRVAFDQAALGALPIGIVALCAGLLWLVERHLAARPTLAAPAGPPPAGVPTPWMLAGLHGTSILMPSLGWFSWSVSVGWERHLGGMAILTWALLGLGVAAVFAGAFGALQQRLDRMAHGTALRIHLAGLVLVAHWLVWFALGLWREPFFDGDAQYTILWWSFAWVTLGTWVASVGFAIGRVATASGSFVSRRSG